MQNQIKQQVDALLSKDMDRKVFLQHVAVGLAGIVGVMSVINGLSKLERFGKAPASQGYGASAYGGKPNKLN